MIEFMRHYWWAAGLIAAGIVVFTHAYLVKLIAKWDSAEQSQDKKSS